MLDIFIEAVGMLASARSSKAAEGSDAFFLDIGTLPDKRVASAGAGHNFL